MTTALADPREGMTITAIAPWFGSKRTMAPRIARECCHADGRPPAAFWDLCCGSLAVSMAMPECAHHHAVDLHGEVMNLARIIQDPEKGPIFYRQLRRILSHQGVLEQARAELADHAATSSGNALFDRGPRLTDIELAIKFFVTSWQSRNGVAGTERVNYQQALRWTSGGGHGAVRFRNAVRSIPAWRRRLRSILFVEKDIFEIVERVEDQDGTTIYIDPPYVRDGARTGHCGYLHEFNEHDHRRLAKKLSRFKHLRVVISYYDDPVVRALYPVANWTYVDCATQKNLHVQNSRGQGRCEAPEILIINGPSFTTQDTTT